MYKSQGDDATIVNPQPVGEAYSWIGSRNGLDLQFFQKLAWDVARGGGLILLIVLLGFGFHSFDFLLSYFPLLSFILVRTIFF